MMPFILCLVALGMQWASPAAALETYVRTSWAHEDGLPSTLIYAITQTRDGYLWLGTSDGLVRFDGINFVPQKIVSSTDPLLGTVTALCAAKDGNLWIGSASGFITRLSSVGSKKYHVGAEVEAIASDSGNQIWVVAENGLYKFDGFSEGNLAPTGKMDPEEVTRAAQASVEIPTIYSHRVIVGGHALFLDQGKQGQIWLAVNRLEQKSTPFLVLHDKRGNLWSVSSGSGLVRTTNIGRKLTPELESDLVESLFEDREGNIWIGTNNGLHCYRIGKFSSLTKRDGFTTDKVTSVEASGRTVWVGTQAGLNRVDGSSVEQCLRDLNVLAVKNARNHQVWASTTEGVFIVTGAAGTLTTQRVADLVSVTAIEEDAEDRIWLADARKGLHSWKRGILTPAAGGLGGDARVIKTIRAQRDGELWIGFFGGGLGVYKQGSFREFSAAAHPPPGTVNDVYVQSPEEVWLGTDSGLFRFNGKLFAVWTTETGLPGNRILWLQPDAESHFWLGLSTGIARIRRADLPSSGPLPSRKLQFDFYDAGDGLLANPVRRSQSAASMDSEGRLWITTSAGIAIIDSRHIEMNSVPPPVVIEKVVADNQGAAIGQTMQFPPLTKHLQIDYAGLSLAVPRKVQFRYQLEGYEREWQNAGTRRQAFYTNLRPGTYRFHVTAANNDGLWNQHGPSFAFSILPAFYQTQLFKMLCVVAAAAMVWGLYRLRLRQMQAAWNTRWEERLAERTRIAQDLHDELLQNAMGVSLQIELSDSLIEEQHASKPHLQRALTLSRALMQKGREVLRDLRERARDGSDIARILRETMDEFRQGGASSSLTVEGTPYTVNPMVADNLTQIGRQAIANAFQHAAARKIDVRMSYSASELCLEVKDDGCGIESRIAETGRASHYGLAGMRERAKQIGGTLSITSQPREGTKVTVMVPAKHAFSERRKHD